MALVFETEPKNRLIIYIPEMISRTIFSGNNMRGKLNYWCDAPQTTNLLAEKFHSLNCPFIILFFEIYWSQEWLGWHDIGFCFNKTFVGNIRLGKAESYWKLQRFCHLASKCVFVKPRVMWRFAVKSTMYGKLISSFYNRTDRWETIEDYRAAWFGG